MPDSIVSEELQLLEDVLRALEDEPLPLSATESSLVRELEQIRALLVSGQEQKDQLALLEQWDRGSALLRQLQASRKAPRVDPDSPYFAHLRLREDGKERDVCLGKATCIRRGVRVVDWRNAPISRLFYRYLQGEGYEEELGGRTVVGEVVARRTVSIRAGRLDRVVAPEGSFVRNRQGDGGWLQTSKRAPQLGGGEGAALRAHGVGAGRRRRLATDPSGATRRVDKHLPDIASLLDPDQFELISRPGSGFLLVRGSAGSGKTTVALHRIAYLAYQDPRVDSARTLFVTLSPALRDYVSHVLPSLGVYDVRVLTFEEWARAQRRRLFPEFGSGVREHAPDYVRRLKLHPAFGIALEEHVRREPGPRTREQARDDWASALTNLQLLQEVFDVRAAGAIAAAELRRVVDWCRARNEELADRLEGDEDVPVALDPEDDALLLRAWQLRVGPLPFRDQRPLSYRHLAVDEAQDFSPLELSVLIDCLDDPPSLTLAGDTQQHLVENSGFTSWNDLFEWLGLRRPEVETLRITYRSTREIMHFARHVLGPLWEDESPPTTARKGPPVETFRFTDHGACVAFLADALRQLGRDEPLASVAVLTPCRAVTDLYWEGLEASEVPRLGRVVEQRFSFAPGVEVAEIDQAKGLEFDYVVLVDVGADRFRDTPSARRLLHVGATRAVHQLWVTSVGTPSPLLP